MSKWFNYSEEIQLDVADGNSFVQEFISNPLLISGRWEIKKQLNLISNSMKIEYNLHLAFCVFFRMFDIGVYTVMTSVNPLRVYIFTADVLIRWDAICCWDNP